jgi:hypothetical protein
VEELPRHAGFASLSSDMRALVEIRTVVFFSQKLYKQKIYNLLCSVGGHHHGRAVEEAHSGKVDFIGIL